MVMPPQEAGANSQTGHWLWGLGIPKNAPNKDAGWYFIQYMTDPANTAELGKWTGGAPRMSSYDDAGYVESLVPEYAEHAATGSPAATGEVRIDPVQVQNIGVVSRPARVEEIARARSLLAAGG